MVLPSLSLGTCQWSSPVDPAPSGFQMQTLLFATHNYVSLGPWLQPLDLSSCHHPCSRWWLSNGPQFQSLEPLHCLLRQKGLCSSNCFMGFEMVWWSGIFWVRWSGWAQGFVQEESSRMTARGWGWRAALQRRSERPWAAEHSGHQKLVTGRKGKGREGKRLSPEAPPEGTEPCWHPEFTLWHPDCHRITCHSCLSHWIGGWQCSHSSDTLCHYVFTCIKVYICSCHFLPWNSVSSLSFGIRMKSKFLEIAAGTVPTCLWLPWPPTHIFVP